MEILRSSLDLTYYKMVEVNFFFGFSSLCCVRTEKVSAKVNQSHINGGGIEKIPYFKNLLSPAKGL